MKHILIPARCGSSCLSQLKLAMNLFIDEQVTCLFLQIRPLPDNYNDMMTLHKNMGKYQFFDQSFTNEVASLREEFGARLIIRTDYIYGDSPAVFRNYAKHHAIDLVVYDKNEWDKTFTEANLNIFRMVSRSGCELMYVSGTHSLRAKVIAVDDHARQQNTTAPDSVMFQYNVIDNQLNMLRDGMYNSNRIISKKINRLSRYFLNESFIQKILQQSECSLILISSK